MMRSMHGTTLAKQVFRTFTNAVDIDECHLTRVCMVTVRAGHSGELVAELVEEAHGIPFLSSYC